MTAAQTEAVSADLQRSLRRPPAAAGGGGRGSGAAPSSDAAGALPWVPVGSRKSPRPLREERGPTAALSLPGGPQEGTSSRAALTAQDLPKEMLLKLHERRLRLQHMADAQANSRRRHCGHL